MNTEVDDSVESSSNISENMRTAKRWSWCAIGRMHRISAVWAGAHTTWLLMALSLAGCRSSPGSVEKSLMNDRLNVARAQGVSEKYLASCPDVIELRIAGRDDLSHDYPIGVDGLMELDHYGPVRAEGKSLAEIST